VLHQGSGKNKGPNANIGAEPGEKYRRWKSGMRFGGWWRLLRLGRATFLTGGNLATSPFHEILHALALAALHLLEPGVLFWRKAFGDLAIQALKDPFGLLTCELAQPMEFLVGLCDRRLDLLLLLIGQIEVACNPGHVDLPEMFDGIPIRLPCPMDAQGSTRDSACDEDACKNEKNFPGEVHGHDWLMISVKRSCDN
jgi:hypothetical protein